MTPIMNKQETCNWVQKRQKSSDRICISRYQDGEYLLMENENYLLRIKNRIIEDATVIGPLLRKSIARPGQLVCINDLKPHNVDDVWVRTHNYLKKNGGQEMYGGANWAICDYLQGSIVLPYFFQKKTLIIGRYAEGLSNFLISANPEIKGYTTASARSSDKYTIYLSELKDACGQFDNIVFACGPLSKVLLADLIDECDANLVDVGSFVNALLEGLAPNSKCTKTWNMSWAYDKNLTHLSNLFLGNLAEMVDKT